MEDRIKHIQRFTGGINTVLAPKLMPDDKSEYILNCNVFSNAEGNVGAVSNIKGTVEVEFTLPAGYNKTIGWAADEEKNNLYFFVYNSLGYHGIYRYNAVDNSVVSVMVCISDTGGEDIFKWNDRDLILHANVIGNNILYWCVRGSRHPARKINIDKAMDRTPTGYNGVIKEEYTRAYKKQPIFPPTGHYFTDTSVLFNRVYGRLFKFAIRYGYDDNEWSNWSSFSDVPVPDFELYTGSLSVPKTNNGIKVSFNTGGFLVRKIEVAMMSTDPEGGTTRWVSLEILEKDKLGIADDSEYVYNFYNDIATLPIGDQLKVYRPYSYLPKDPFCQDFVNNALIYSNFYEGFPDVNIDVGVSVRYEDLFIDSGEDNVINEPSITVINVFNDYFSVNNGLFSKDRFRGVGGTVVIGNDVKSGNTFTFTIYDSSTNPRYTQTVEAGLSDTPRSIAIKLSNLFRNHTLTPGSGSVHTFPGFEIVGNVTTDLSGNAQFDFKYWSSRNAPQPVVTTSATPVETNSLKNAGQSVRNIKLGSTAGYAIVYHDKDTRKSAAYRTQDMTVSIDDINALGGIKKPVIELEINHTPPDWAYSYQIVRTPDLVYSNYIQLLIQKTVKTTKGSDEYIDLIVGSLFTYQSIHPNSTLAYEFKKGDRVRLIKNYDGSDWVIPSEVHEFEVLSYSPLVEDVINDDIEIDGSEIVTVGEASTDHIGSFIRVNGSEREIISVPSGNTYELSAPLTTGDPDNTTKTFSSYEIINTRGVLRIKSDPDSPIIADPENNKFPLVEVYSPASGQSSVDEDMFYEFGLVLPIINPGTSNAYHAGTVVNQSVGQPAVVEIDSGTSYVRYRELPVSNDADNPQVVVSEIEDPSYSDFYVSDMNGNGKPIPLDRGDGEVLFDERMRFSNNYIQGTRINGLNDFDNIDRRDYNDKYGAIERIWFEDGLLYVFKHLKDAWAPVYASIITDNSGSELLAKSDQLLPDRLQYYAWDGGVGDNPESVARIGTQFYHVSPNSMKVCRIGGNGVDPISEIYGVDNTVRDIISSAKRAGAQIHGGADRHNGKYDVSVESHDNVISDTPFSDAAWSNDIEELPTSGLTYVIVTPPAHGTLTGSSDVPLYTPDPGYNGPDTFSYEIFQGGVSLGVRNVCLTVVHQEGPKAWRATSSSCVLENGASTGYLEWMTLEEYDTYSGVATGLTKPNVLGDPDYVAPAVNHSECPPQSILVINNTDTDLLDPYRLFVDTDVEVWINGNMDYAVRGTDSISIQLTPGDTVELRQKSDTDNNPWPVNSNSTFEVKKGSVVLHSSSDSVQKDLLATYTFVAQIGGYIANSLGVSTATGYRKYTTDCERLGAPGVILLGHEFTDDTINEVCSEKGAGVGLAEYNTVDDAGTLTIRTENQDETLSFNVEITGTTTRSFVIGPESNHIETLVPKGNIKIVCTSI